MDNTLQLVDDLERLDGLTTLDSYVPNELQFRFDIPIDFPLGQIDVYVVLSLEDGNLIKPTEPDQLQ